MQHFLTRAFRLPTLIALLFGITLSGQVLAQQSLSTLMFFDGVGPQGGLVSDGAAFYGASTAGGYPAPGGLLYRLAQDSSSIATIYEYGRLEVWTGANPSGRLLLSSDGNLYGATANNSIDMLRGGQTIGTGTIFHVARDGTNYTKLYEFELLTLDSRQYLINTTGALPQAGLIEGLESGVKYLYGTAFQGGPDGTGTVFKIRADGTGFQVIHNFGAAYLKTGGTGSLDFDTNPEGRLKNADGVNPNQRLMLAADGNLYGVTTGGGANGTGVVFRLAVDGSNFLAVSFDISPPTITDSTDTAHYGKPKSNTTGGYPAGGLIQASNGLLYGTANALGGMTGPPGSFDYGNGFGYGTVFRFDPNNPAIQTLVAFTGDVAPNPGAGPSGELIIATDGMLVGTTQGGGNVANDTAAGTVFKLSLDGITHVQECIFTLAAAGTKGATPNSGVIQAGDGGFFGTAIQGGFGNGVIFKCGTPHGAPPLGIPPPIDDGGGVLPLWMIALMGMLLAVQLARRGRPIRFG